METEKWLQLFTKPDLRYKNDQQIFLICILDMCYRPGMLQCKIYCQEMSPLKNSRDLLLLVDLVMRMYLDQRKVDNSLLCGSMILTSLNLGWAACALFNPKIRAQLNDFRDREDSFSLGVCNGCQLMALLGWIGNLKTDMPKENYENSDRYKVLYRSY